MKKFTFFLPLLVLLVLATCKSPTNVVPSDKARFLDVVVKDAGDNLVEDFTLSLADSGPHDYILTLGSGTKLEGLFMIPQVSPGASTTPERLEIPDDLNTPITFTIVSEDKKTTINYSLQVLKNFGTEANFLNVAVYDADDNLVEGTTLTPADSGPHDYILTLKPGMELESLSMIPEFSPWASGPEELEMPADLDTPISFEVISEDEKTTIAYSLRIDWRPLSTEAKFLDLKLYNAGNILVEGTTLTPADSGPHDYILTLKPSTELSDPFMIPEFSLGASGPEELEMPADLDIPISFEVISEDEKTTITYSLKIDFRPKGTEARFLSVKLYNAENILVEGTTLSAVDGSLHDYILTLSVDTKISRFIAFPEVSSWASSRPKRLEINDLNTPVSFSVISEDEKNTIHYTLKVLKTLGTEARFLDVEVYDADNNLVEGITLEDPSDGSDEYLLTLSPGTDPANVSLIPKVSIGASIKPETLAVPDDLDKPISFDVISEDGETTIPYSLKVSRTLGTEARFLGVEVYDADDNLVEGTTLEELSDDSADYLLTLGLGTDLANVSLIPKASPGASINPDSLVVPDDLDIPISFEVISEDGETTIPYSLKVWRTLGTEARFLGVDVYDADDNLVEGTTLDEPNDDSDDYVLTLGIGTDPANVSLIPKASPGASINPDSLVVPDDLDIPISFEVISEDGETTIPYSLKVWRTLGTEARFLGVEVYDADDNLVEGDTLTVADSGQNHYVLTLVPNMELSDLTDLYIIPKVSPAASSIPERLEMPDDLNTPIIFEVISEDQENTLNYNLKIVLPEREAFRVKKDNDQWVIADPQNTGTHLGIWKIENLLRIGSAKFAEIWTLTEDYVLMEDLDFTNQADYIDPNNKELNADGDNETPLGVMAELTKNDAGTNRGFIPIGNKANPFNGSFQGNGKMISNLYINRSSPTSLGFFGVAGENSMLTSLGLIDVEIDVSSLNSGFNGQVGGLVGGNYGDISKSYVTGKLTGYMYTGGLVGRNFPAATISDSYATASIDSQKRGSGGLVGYNEGDISKSYATGRVGSVPGAPIIGGLVGENSYRGTISKSYATGDVNSEDDGGGLVGDNYGDISESYATGNVYGRHAAGGLVGFNESKKAISNSYATGNVRSISSAGGLVGRNSGAISKSYATGNVDGNVDGDKLFPVGGLVAVNIHADSGHVYDNIAFGDTVDGKDEEQVRRVIGRNSALINNNHANALMKVNESSRTSEEKDSVHGKDMTAEDFVDKSFYSNIENFSEPWNFTEIWEIKLNAKRPTLIENPDSDPLISP